MNYFYKLLNELLLNELMNVNFQKVDVFNHDIFHEKYQTSSIRNSFKQPPVRFFWQECFLSGSPFSTKGPKFNDQANLDGSREK